MTTTGPDIGAPNPELDELLDFLKRSRGFDFTGYKRSTLERRIRKRMEEVGDASYSVYQDRLEVDPHEFVDLFNTILINVTGFFRDPPAWAYLREEIVPKLLEEGSEDHPIRVWSAACASGEEAYSAAILLAEAMGEEAFHRRVKIYATDIDEEALAKARAATYQRDALKHVDPGLVDRYFEQVAGGLCFRPDLRRSIIFGRNDLMQDAPISRIDLLISRNALMYFTTEAQAHILRRLNFALGDSGFLFLGKSEMLITHADLFTPYNLKWRVFRKVPRVNMRDRFAFVGDEVGFVSPQLERYARLRDGAFDVVPAAVVVLDRSNFVTIVNEHARTMFGLGPADIGRPLQDLELSYRPVELRSALERAYAERQTVNLGRFQWSGQSVEERTLEARVTPLPGRDGGDLGAAIAFEDVTEFARLDEEHTRAKRALETAYGELQSTVEELETTNEELQSTNEELETTNEELQSTNEELETMNEELQSTNDELETVNDEQRERTRELDQLTLFLEGILVSLGLGVVVLDRGGHVQLWNASSQELWGLRADEVEGERFVGLDVGLPVIELAGAIDAATDDGRETEIVLSAVNRRGRAIECTVRTLPLRGADGEAFGVILLMSGQAQDGGG